jgi:hypothetical protein
MMEAVSTSEMSALYLTTLLNIPEDCHLFITSVLWIRVFLLENKSVGYEYQVERTYFKVFPLLKEYASERQARTRSGLCLMPHRH